MLSICFFDAVQWDYNVDAPLQRPFGGSQSALCYLAIELVKLGHHVTLLSNTSKPGTVLGVNCLNQRAGTKQFFTDNKFDAVVVINGPAELSMLRWDLPDSTVLLLWNQVAVDQPILRGLASRSKLKKWDHIVCVSDWQRQAFIDKFNIDATQISVIRNAIAPAFENLFPSRKALVTAKAEGLSLAYTSTPFRGLHVLLNVFPAIKAQHPEAVLEVYSSMAVYLQPAGNDQYGELYDTARNMAGVKYLGSIPQPQLARALARANIFSYPNTWAETSCIAMLEALAAGLLVVTSDLGVLPETCQGFANLVPFVAAGPVRDVPYCYSLQEIGEFIANYRNALSDAIETYDPDRLYEQVEVINRGCTWRVRALEWTQFLQRMVNNDATSVQVTSTSQL